jgi:ethanolamine utilization protein EutN
MRLGKVVGAVWGGKEASSLEVSKLLQVQVVKFRPGQGPLDVRADGPDVPLQDGLVIALDRLGAGIGEYVLVAHGSRVRDLTVGPDLPTKDVVVAIVDACQVETDLFPDGVEP